MNFIVITETHPTDRAICFETLQMIPVFHLGEILICIGDREITGRRRKPSRWDCEYEEFGEDLQAAIDRAVEVGG